jgi:hypothetical protein
MWCKAPTQRASYLDVKEGKRTTCSAAWAFLDTEEVQGGQ